MKTLLRILAACLLVPVVSEGNSRRFPGTYNGPVADGIAIDRARYDTTDPNASAEQRAAAWRRYEEARRQAEENERRRREAAHFARMAELERHMREMEEIRRNNENRIQTGPYNRR